jgi:serine/threonine-protein kinase
MGAVAAPQAVPSATGRTAVVGAAVPAADDKEDLERKKRTRRLVILLVLLLVALAIIAFFLLRSVLGGDVTVPDVVGQTTAQATQSLQKQNLSVGATHTVINTTVQSGNVISTSPKAGASVAKNSAVDLTVSAGPPVSVPSVVTQQLAQAEQLLTAAGLGYNPRFVSSNKAVGTVLTQDPAAQAKVKAGTKVQLTVSGNQTSVLVPSVIGQTTTSAAATLTKDNLNVGNQTNGCSGQVSNGLVQAQNPAPGATVQPNDSVNLVVSNCVRVPGVVGQSSNQAQSSISGAGLSPNVTTDSTCANGATAGTVDAQNPGPGGLAGPGTTVNLSVCQPVTTTSSPPSTTSSTTTSTTSSTQTTSHLRRRP